MIIENKAQLVEYISSGCKREDQFAIGVEHEKFLYNKTTHQPLTFLEIESVFKALQDYGWHPIYEGEHIIAMHDGQNNGLSLEPGGAFELSTKPYLVKDIEALIGIHDTHFHQLSKLAHLHNFGMLGLGFTPFWQRSEMPLMPKARYDIMRNYMPKKGTLGLDMMHRTCTIQANFDFSSEADMVKKFRVALNLQPFITALFAASSLTEGSANGYQSYRSHIWEHTDPDRCGMLPFVFEDDFGFERYVDYVLDVPMYFIKREGKYIDYTGQTFRTYMQKGTATLQDFIDHMTTVFPEVRLKHYLEMRGADMGPKSHIMALSLLWLGILYDQPSLDAAWEMVKYWHDKDRAYLRRTVPKMGIHGIFRQKPIICYVTELLNITKEGLQHITVKYNLPDLLPLLRPLEVILAEKSSIADRLRHTPVDEIYKTFSL